MTEENKLKELLATPFRELARARAHIPKEKAKMLIPEYAKTDINHEMSYYNLFKRMFKEYESHVVFQTKNWQELCPLPVYKKEMNMKENQAYSYFIGKKERDVECTVSTFNSNRTYCSANQNELTYHLYGFINKDENCKDKVIYHDTLMFLKQEHYEIVEYSLLKAHDKDPTEFYNDIRSFFYDKKLEYLLELAFEKK